jgi:hypothetical protein
LVVADAAAQEQSAEREISARSAQNELGALGMFCNKLLHVDAFVVAQADVFEPGENQGLQTSS